MRVPKLIVILFAFNTARAQVQSASDLFQDKVYAYSRNHLEQTLFVHFDKNIYLSRENIWFASYLVTHSAVKNKILSIGLVNHATNKIIKTDQFIILSEYSAGKISIPDSLPSGKYDLICFTDVLKNNRPNDVFIQTIEIRSSQKKDFNISLLAQNQENSNQIVIKTTTKDLLPASSVELNCLLISNKTKIEASGKTDNKGIFTFIVPDSIAQQTVMLVATAHKNGQLQQNSIILNRGTNKRQVHFYPEGGNLIETIKSRVGVEIANADGTKQIDSVFLVENGETVEKVVTDKNGMAIFHVTPQAGHKIILRIPVGGQYQDFGLPTALHDGVGIQSGSPTEKNNLRLVVSATTKGKFSVIIHNYREVFGVYAANFTGPASTIIQAPGEALPTGLFTITIINESGNPVAEKVIYRKPEETSAITITTAKPVFEKNNKIKISIKSSVQDPGNGALSIACVNQDRINYSMFKRIDNYEYLYHELSTLISYANGSSIDPLELEKLLLIKGWSNYKTNTLINTDVNDTLLNTYNVTYSGSVKKNTDNKPRKNASVSILTDSSANVSTTDGLGQFKVANESLITYNNSGNVNLIINNDKQKEFFLAFANPYVDLLQKVIDSVYSSHQIEGETVQANHTIDDFADQTAILDGVTVKSRSSGSIWEYVGYHANACGDWVCLQNALNCPVHLPTDPGSYKPIKGKNYKNFIIQFDGTGKYLADQVYVGCILEEGKGNASNIFQGIHNVKDYYMPIRSDGYYKNNSILHWESLKQLSSGEAYDLEFESGQTPGTYLLIVQGILNNKPVYKEQIIIVE